MLRAQIRGVIDWSKTAFFDKCWWQRVRLLLSEIIAEDTRRLREIFHQDAIAYRTAVAIGKFSDDSWSNFSKSAQDCLDAVLTAYRPWENIDREQREKDEAKQLIGGWKERYGDPQDPVVARKIQELADAMMLMAAEEAPGLRYRGSIFNKTTAASLPLRGN